MPKREPERQIKRLAALREYDVLDTPPEETFDRITRLARASLRKPVSLISFADENRQWFKSVQGLEITSARTESTFCAYLADSDEMLVVEDTLRDSRFQNNPFVVGVPHIRFYAGSPLITPGGQNIGALCVLDFVPGTLSAEERKLLDDLARLVVDELDLRKLAGIDGLTGALTRQTFQRQAEREFARAIRYKRELSCIVFDLDHFKSINDTYGHAIGDMALRATADLARSTLRTIDLFGRIGGEEFAIVMPETGLDGASQAAERLRTNLAGAPICDLTRRLTASFGVAAYDSSDGRIDSLLRRADRALYEAKGSGRDRVGQAAA